MVYVIVNSFFETVNCVYERLELPYLLTARLCLFDYDFVVMYDVTQVTMVTIA